MFEINKLSEGIDSNNLTYCYTDKSVPKYFAYFKGTWIIYNDIKNGRIGLQKAEKVQEEFQSKLNELLKGNPNSQSKDQISAIKNIKKLFKGQKKVFKFYRDCIRMVSEDKYK